MAKFKVSETFNIRSKNYFVIVGDIISGTISSGMFLHCNNKTYFIISVDFVQKRINGIDDSKVAICLELNEDTPNVLLDTCYNID